MMFWILFTGVILILLIYRINHEIFTIAFCFTFFPCLVFSALIYAQTNQWVNFSSQTQVNFETLDGQYLWIGTQTYLTRLNTLTGEKSVIKSGSQFLSAAVDHEGVKWIGTAGNGLLKYDGQTWTEYNTSNSSLPDNSVASIAVDSLGNKWIGTLSHGMEEFREGGIVPTGVKNIKSGIPDRFALTQNYPNPFNPTTRISYSIPESHNVKLIIYDMLGKEVAALVNEYKEAGNYTIEFNASSLPSGIYIYTIQAGHFRDSKKLVLLK